VCVCLFAKLRCCFQYGSVLNFLCLSPISKQCVFIVVYQKSIKLSFSIHTRCYNNYTCTIKQSPRDHVCVTILDHLISVQRLSQGVSVTCFSYKYWASDCRSDRNVTFVFFFFGVGSQIFTHLRNLTCKLL
jgi:hypothetical protein